MPADQWLATIKQQVAAQYLVLKSNPGLSGFTAAFTAPMTITGSAKIFSIYTSKEVFNGQVIVKFSTDGKILDRRQAELRRRQHLGQRPPVRRPLARQLGRRHGALPGRRPRPGAHPDALRPPEDGLPQRVRPGGRVHRAGRAAADPDADPRRPAAAATRSRSRRDQRPRLRRRHVHDARRAHARPRVDRRHRSGVHGHADGGGTVALDTSQAPLLLDAATNTYRYWLLTKGTVSGITIAPIEKSWAATGRRHRSRSCRTPARSPRSTRSSASTGSTSS